MDAARVVEALNWQHGVRLKLNPDKTRLVLPRADAARLPEDLKEAMKANHDELLRGELFKDGLLRLHHYMVETHDADPDGPEYAAAIAGVGADGTDEALNDAWADADLDAFKRALSDYLRAGARAFRDALTTDAPVDEPALPLAEEDRGAA